MGCDIYRFVASPGKFEGGVSPGTGLYWLFSFQFFRTSYPQLRGVMLKLALVDKFFCVEDFLFDLLHNETKRN